MWRSPAPPGPPPAAPCPGATSTARRCHPRAPAGHRARRLVEREPLGLGHLAVRDEQQERLVGAAALETRQRLHLGLAGARTETIHRLGRVRDQPAPGEMRHRALDGGRHLLISVEREGRWERAHRRSRASASAIRKSSAVVTLKLYAVSGTTSTGRPARSHIVASSLAASPLARSAYARSIMSRGKPCGV